MGTSLQASKNEIAALEAKVGSMSKAQRKAVDSKGKLAEERDTATAEADKLRALNAGLESKVGPVPTLRASVCLGLAVGARVTSSWASPSLVS